MQNKLYGTHYKIGHEETSNSHELLFAVKRAQF